MGTIHFHEGRNRRTQVNGNSNKRVNLEATKTVIRKIVIIRKTVIKRETLTYEESGQGSQRSVSSPAV